MPIPQVKLRTPSECAQTRARAHPEAAKPRQPHPIETASHSVQGDSGPGFFELTCMYLQAKLPPETKGMVFL